MPFVRIDLFEGRTLEQKKALAKEAVSYTHLDVYKRQVYPLRFLLYS